MTTLEPQRQSTGWLVMASEGVNSSSLQPMRRLPLSVCLITRDEAHNLPGLMASLGSIAQEVVVVDTGSVDGTPELARALGARVLSSPWQNDFSQARNVALAAATAPWILSMDADQKLDAASLPMLEAALQLQDCVAQLVTIKLLGPANPDGGQNVVRCLPSIRLFKRDDRVRYRGRVHEDVSDSLINMGSTHWPDSGVTLTDHGYMEESARRQKLARNLALLRQAVQEQPTALHLAHKLVMSLPQDAVVERGRVLQAALSQALCTSDAALRELACLPRLLAAGLQAWVVQGRLEEAALTALTLWQRVGTHLDFTAGRALARAGMFSAARQALTSFVREPGRESHEVQTSHSGLSLFQQDEDSSVQEACRWLAWLSDQEGKHSDAIRWIERGKQAAGPYAHPPLNALEIEMLIRHGNVDDAMRVFEDWSQALNLDPDGLRVALPELMASSARLALACGDLISARELARQAAAAEDDAGATLLVQIALAEDPQLDVLTLDELARSIQGSRFDTLALNLKCAAQVGRVWPYRIPAATSQLLSIQG